MKPHELSLRREIEVILVVILIGEGLRIWSHPRLGLQHFDEGIYALSGLWIASPAGPAAIDPAIIPYAPPVYPILVGIAYLLLGVADISAIAVSIACGVLTIGVVGWLGRRTFGPGAGAVASSLAAFSGPHVAFSRMALTDSTFLLAWLIGIGLGARFLEKPGLARALVFGLAVGLAQNVKYNGWIVGAVVASVAGVDLICKSGPGRRTTWRAIGYGCVSAAIAALIYLPWFQFVDRHGGYSSLLEHHRSYMGGVATWWPHWKLQMAEATALSGLAWGTRGSLSWGLIAWPVCWLSCAFSCNRHHLVASGTRSLWARFGIGLVAGATALGALPNLPWWSTLVLAPWLIRSERIAVRVLGWWWLILSFSTPFYHPYARLWLPLHAVGWLIVGGLVVELGRFGNPTLLQDAAAQDGLTRRGPYLADRLAGLAVALALFEHLVLLPAARPLPGLLSPSDSLRWAVKDLVKTWPVSRPPVQVVARPCVTYYLVILGGPPVQTRSSIEQLVETSKEGDRVLLDMVQIRQEAHNPHLSTSALRRPSLRFWWLYAAHVNLPTLLDVDPGVSLGDVPTWDGPLLLFRVRPKPPSSQP